LETVYDLWKEELTRVDRALGEITMALMEGDRDRAYRKLYELVLWWNEQRKKYDLDTLNDTDSIKKFLMEVASGEHPIGHEYLLPRVTISKFVEKALELIKSGLK